MKSDTTEEHWLEILLMFVLRLHILREIGLEPTVIESRVLEAQAFRRALRALQARK